MSSHKKERPGGNSGASIKSLAGDYQQSTEGRVILEGLRRRRAAALRLPPLESGRRDPLFNWERVG